MRATWTWLAGVTLVGFLACLVTGCGGSSNSTLAKPPATAGPPDMSQMPGFDAKSGKMQTSKTK